MQVNLSRIPTSAIVERWRTEMWLEVEHLFAGVDHIDVIEDERSGLFLLSPPVTGDDAFYQKLQQVSWYYLRDKWEYKHTLRRLVPGCRILEVGGGSGHFMRLVASQGHDCVGIELNSEAVEVARHDGLDMRRMTLEEFRALTPHRFDRVVSFQVLEHVSDPIAMLDDMWALTEDHGRLCYAVPNARSFIRHANSLMDLPPHHVSRWTSAAAHKIGELLGARETIVVEAPVEPVHYEWCANILLGRLPGGRLTNNRISRPLMATALKLSLIHI